MSPTTTSGTNIFTMDVDDLLDRALQPLGGEWTSGQEANEARTTLNLLLIELQNKNVPLNKINSTTVSLQEDVFEYTLDGAISDVLELTVSQGTDVDIPTERWGMRDYHQIPNKQTKQRPTIWSTDRGRDTVKLKFWPIPDKAYTAKLLVINKIEDITAAYQKIDLPTRYLPLIIKWLSYELALNRPSADPDLLVKLKMRLDEAMPDTFDEDRERVNFTITPGGISGR